MNIAQIIRRALIETNQVLADGTSNPLITQNELLAAAQDCMKKMFFVLKHSDANWDVAILDSTDSAFNFERSTYTATSSLVLAASTRDYTLPPDFFAMQYIRAISTAQQHIEFVYLDFDDPLFLKILRAEHLTTGSSTPDLFYYTIYGDRTLRFANFPGGAFDIEIGYQARTPFLWIYDGAGSAAVTQDDATVTFSAGTLAISGLTIPAEIMFNSTGAAAHPVTLSTDSTATFITVAPYEVGATGIQGPWPIDSFTDDTNLELQQTWPYSTDSSLGYILCAAPPMLRTHARVALDYLRWYIFDRVGSPKANEALQKHEQGMQEMTTDMSVRSSDPEFVEEYEYGY